MKPQRMLERDFRPRTPDPGAPAHQAFGLVEFTAKFGDDLEKPSELDLKAHTG